MVLDALAGASTWTASRCWLLKAKQRTLRLNLHSAPCKASAAAVAAHEDYLMPLSMQMGPSWRLSAAMTIRMMFLGSVSVRWKRISPFLPRRFSKEAASSCATAEQLGSDYFSGCLCPVLSLCWTCFFGILVCGCLGLKQRHPWKVSADRRGFRGPCSAPPCEVSGSTPPVDWEGDAPLPFEPGIRLVKCSAAEDVAMPTSARDFQFPVFRALCIS